MIDRILSVVGWIIVAFIFLAIANLITGCTSDDLDRNADRAVWAQSRSAQAGGAYQIIRGQGDASGCGVGEIGDPPQARVTIDHESDGCQVHVEAGK